MKKTALLLSAALFLACLPCAAQGPLAPPGAPGAMMKTLDQVEPRTPISSLPYTITNSGSYYVVSNLFSATHGIVIQTSGVSVDLMGFALRGNGGFGSYGIHVVGATNVVVKGGTVSRFHWGLYCLSMNNSRIERMVVSGNSNYGVYLNGSTVECNGNSITDCAISGNGNAGVYFSGVAGQCNGNIIADCAISGNAGYGVYLKGNTGQCSGNTIRENTISKNTGRGVYLYYSDGNRVEANHVWGTTGGTTYGIYTASGTGNFIVNNSCVGQTNNFELSANDTFVPVEAVQSDPRTPILSLPYTITNSGSYYLVSNLASATTGIVIQASGVTVDLMGFSITGNGIKSGIYVGRGGNDATNENLLIKDGTISGFRDGFVCYWMNNSRLEHLLISDNVQAGVVFLGWGGQCNGNIIADCIISGNGEGVHRYDAGVYIQSADYGQCDGNTITDCTISGNHGAGITFEVGFNAQCNRNTIANCSISGNVNVERGEGIRVFSLGGLFNGNRIVGCTISGNSSRGVHLEAYLPDGQCSGNTIADCTIRGNNESGIWLYGGDGNTIADCTVSDNGRQGVYLSSVYGGNQCDGNTIADCTISGNTSNGIYLVSGTGQCNGNAILNCTISKNLDRGVDLVGTGGQCDGNTIQGNRIMGNAERGIAIYWGDGNRVEANTIWGTSGAPSYGIRTVNTTNNFILKNTCVGQTDNFELDPNDTYGPIVTNSGALPTSGAAAHPWANFSR